MAVIARLLSGPGFGNARNDRYLRGVLDRRRLPAGRKVLDVAAPGAELSGIEECVPTGDVVPPERVLGIVLHLGMDAGEKADGYVIGIVRLVDLRAADPVQI